MLEAPDLGLLLDPATTHEELEAHYRLLLSIETDAIYILDEHWRIIAANATALRLYGYARESFIGLAVEALSAEPAQTRETMQELERGRAHPITGRLHRRADGTTFPVDLSSAVALHDGRGRRVCVIARDVSERQRVEAALRESEHRFRALAGVAISGMVIHEEGRILEANARMTELTGYSQEELVGMNALDLAAPSSRGCLAENIASGRETPYEAVGLRKNGSTFFGEIEARAITYQGRPVRVAMVRDISSRKQGEVPGGRIEAQLKQQQKLEAIGMLAASVAHEINNPITGIINYAELLRRRLGEGEDPDQRLVDASRQIMREAERVGGIVRNLLSFARPAEDAPTVLLRLADVVEGTLSLLHTVVTKDQIVLEVDVPADLPPLRCHAQGLQQVLLNLVTNARDALNTRYERYHEDKRIRVTARELVEENARWVRLIVEDHGVGIPADELDRIFLPFVSTKSSQQGTGLGLSVSRGIVAEHGGRLSAESEVGAYTRFFVDLPAASPLRPMESSLG